MKLKKVLFILCVFNTINLTPLLAKDVDLEGKRIVLFDVVNNCGLEVCSIGDEITEYQLLYDSLSNKVVRTQIVHIRENNMPIRRLVSRYWKGHSYRTSHKKEYKFYPCRCPVFHMDFIREDGECVESFSFPINEAPARIPFRLYKYLLNRHFEILRQLK